MKTFVWRTAYVLLWLLASLLPVPTHQALQDSAAFKSAARVDGEQVNHPSDGVMLPEQFHVSVPVNKPANENKKTFHPYLNSLIFAPRTAVFGASLVTPSFSPCFSTHLFLLYRVWRV